jgi:hypothetical protein
MTNLILYEELIVTQSWIGSRASQRGEGECEDAHASRQLHDKKPIDYHHCKQIQPAR